MSEIKGGVKPVFYGAHVIKSKGMPGVTSDKSGTPNSTQSSRDLSEKFQAVRRHA